MDSFLKTPEIIGIGFVAVAAFWVLWKLITKVIDVIEKNSETSNKLVQTITANTDVTKQTANMISGMQEQIKKQGDFIEILTRSLLEKKQ